MGKNEKSNFDKEFSGAIDKMLAGEKIEPYTDMPDDYREAIDFAQKLISLKDAPRPSFKVELKDSLLSKLSEMEQEKAGWKRFQERLRHLVPQRPLWRAVAASLLVIVVAGGVIWGTGIFTHPMTPPSKTPLPPPQQPVMLEITSVKATYSLGGETEFTSSKATVVTPLPRQMANTPSEVAHWEETVWYSPMSCRKPNLGPEGSVEYNLIWTTGGD
jgi:hypothetical protein